MLKSIDNFFYLHKIVSILTKLQRSATMCSDYELIMEFRKLSKLAERRHRQDCNADANRPTFVQLWILKYLYDNRDIEIYQKDIEYAFEIRRATATELINQLEKKEFIRREPVGLDKRLKKLTITDKAIAVKQEFEAKTKKLRNDLLHGITAEEKKLLINILHKMQNNLITSTV